MVHAGVDAVEQARTFAGSSAAMLQEFESWSFLASGKTALGAPSHGQGSTSSMPGPMAMRLPTIVDHL